ncbi:MAG TPA: hypothetical protein VFJ17_06655 [Mycobacteriales bacterium]|jgi:hypothetical protein|nr:hypothetical protein [Mycobacteriales bacterium]
MAASDDDRVELTELDVITRYSLAVRSATAPREELISALRDDLAWLEGGRSRRRTTREPAASPARSSSARSTPPGTAKKTGNGRTRSTRTR